MYPAHFLSDHMQQYRTTALQQAEQARLARLAHPEKTTLRQHWLALQHHLSTRLFWNKASSQKRLAGLAIACCLPPCLPGAQCCAL